jgi:hypothetical protein
MVIDLLDVARDGKPAIEGVERARHAHLRRPRHRQRDPRARLAGSSGVVAGVLGLVQAFGELRPELERRGDELHEMAALSTTCEPALLKRVKNFSFRGRIRRAMEVLLGRPYRRMRVPTPREEVVRRSGR